MATGRSLHIGVNYVKPENYDGNWGGNRLSCCEEDAGAMKTIAQQLKYTDPLILPTEEATLERVRYEIAEIGKRLKGGDIFFLSFSGHGGQVEDKPNGDETDDNKDETWALRDGQLVDDELYTMLSKFKKDVRVIVLSDSCHSGSVIANILSLTNTSNMASLTNTSNIAGLTNTLSLKRVEESAKSEFPVRSIPHYVGTESEDRHKSYFDKIQKYNPLGDRIALQASVLLISACTDFDEAREGPQFGWFTGVLRYVWDNGAFPGTYWQFFNKIKLELDKVGQTPKYFRPPGNPGDFDKKLRPFVI